MRYFLPRDAADRDIRAGRSPSRPKEANVAVISKSRGISGKKKAGAQLGADGVYYPKEYFLGSDNRHHAPGAFLGTDGQYHPAGEILFPDGKYRPEGYSLREDGQYHPRNSFVGADGKYHLTGSFPGLAGTNQPHGCRRRHNGK